MRDVRNPGGISFERSSRMYGKDGDKEEKRRRTVMRDGQECGA
jgi:hypothetical protein